MINVYDQQKINPEHLRIVCEELSKRGVQDATIMPGNACVRVSRGFSTYPINEYFIFKNDRLVDVQVD